MPIRPQDRWLYPIDWPQLTDMIRFRRAGGRCEQCRRPHGQVVNHLGDGRWWCDETSRWKDDHGRLLRLRTPPALLGVEIRTTKVVLATAHLDSNPSNNEAANLKALCQRCHIIHDRPEHLRRRRVGFLMSKALGDLFDGVYRFP